MGCSSPSQKLNLVVYARLYNKLTLISQAMDRPVHHYSYQHQISHWREVHEYNQLIVAYHFPVWFGVVHSQILHKTGKSLIQPQVIPPLGRNDVSKPLIIIKNTKSIQLSVSTVTAYILLSS